MEWDTKIVAAKVSIKVGVDCTGQWCLKYKSSTTAGLFEAD